MGGAEAEALTDWEAVEEAVVVGDLVEVIDPVDETVEEGETVGLDDIDDEEDGKGETVGLEENEDETVDEGDIVVDDDLLEVADDVTVADGDGSVHPVRVGLLFVPSGHVPEHILSTPSLLKVFSTQNVHVAVGPDPLNP